MMLKPNMKLKCHVAYINTYLESFWRVIPFVHTICNSSSDLITAMPRVIISIQTEHIESAAIQGNSHATCFIPHPSFNVNSVSPLFFKKDIVWTLIVCGSERLTRTCKAIEDHYENASPYRLYVNRLLSVPYQYFYAGSCSILLVMAIQSQYKLLSLFSYAQSGHGP